MLVKNPFHRDWEIIETGRAYELRDLIREVHCRPAKMKRQKDSNTAQPLIDPSSRNVTVFNLARFYAYECVSECETMQDLLCRVSEYLNRLNYGRPLNYFSEPLPQAEIHSIARSVAKWVWERKDRFMRRRTWSLGAMGFPLSRGLSNREYLLELRRRQRLSGIRTSSLRRERTYTVLLDTYCKEGEDLYGSLGHVLQDSFHPGKS
ncbi:MAG: primase C-terminal domain-containing protein [Candidatus Hadarchaeales archaeon]